MQNIIPSDATPAEFFLGGCQAACEALSKSSGAAAEERIADLISKAAAGSRAVWSRPASTEDGVLKRAAVAFYWWADASGNDGLPCLADLESRDCRDRAAAELIEAILAVAARRNAESTTPRMAA